MPSRITHYALRFTRPLPRGGAGPGSVALLRGEEVIELADAVAPLAFEGGAAFGQHVEFLLPALDLGGEFHDAAGELSDGRVLRLDAGAGVGQDLFRLAARVGADRLRLRLGVLAGAV